MWCRLDTRTTFSSVIKKHICYSWFEPGSSMTTLISPRSMRRNKHSLTMPCVIEVQCSAIRIAWICTNLSSRHLSWTRYQTLHGIKLDEWSDTVTWVSGYLRFGVNYVNTQAPWSHLQDYVASCECAWFAMDCWLCLVGKKLQTFPLLSWQWSSTVTWPVLQWG